MPLAAGALPEQDFTARAPVLNQSQLGSCTAFDYGTALTILSGGHFIPSHLALYRDFRIESGFPTDADTGALMEPAVRALVKHGAGSEAMWPYNISRFAEAPPSEYVQQAVDHRVRNWYRARTVAQVRTAIHNGLPCCAAFDVPPGFSEVGESGWWNDEGGQALGGHAVCVVGYDDNNAYGSSYAAKGAFLAQNSWGTNWGAAHPEDSTEGVDPDFLVVDPESFDESEVPVGPNGLPEGFFWVPYDVYEGHRWWDAIVIVTFDLEAGR